MKSSIKYSNLPKYYLKSVSTLSYSMNMMVCPQEASRDP